MTDLKFKPVRHDHKQFLEQASRRRGFTGAYEALEVEYALAHEMLAARARAGLTQEAVAGRMGTTKSAISRHVVGLGERQLAGHVSVRGTRRRTGGLRGLSLR